MCKAAAPAASEDFAAPDLDASAFASSTTPQISWLRRYTRWRQTSREEGINAENRLMSMAGVNLQAAEVPTGPKPNDFMNTVIGGPPSAPAMVMIPGYGAGVGFFFRNLAALCDSFRVHAVDLLGTGLSGRPTWTARNRKETESFFIDSLSAWRTSMGIDKMILVGHSLGGLLSARYALQHPEHVEHLILVCPAGITKQPEDWQPPEIFRSAFTLPGALFRVFNQCLDWGLTPGAVVRSMGPFGSTMIRNYIHRRFKESMGLTEEETRAFEQYFYHIMSARGSGEHALRYLLGPFAWARAPLEEDLCNLQVPVTFIYGDQDWTGTDGAKRAVEALEQKRASLSPEDQKIITLPKAGHYAFLDQPKLFTEHMRSICSPYLQRTEAALKVSDAAQSHQPGFPAAARNVRNIRPCTSAASGHVESSDQKIDHDTSSAGFGQQQAKSASTADSVAGSEGLKQRPTAATQPSPSQPGSSSHGSVAEEVQKQVEL